ncbi:EAL domain-containing protein (putative c-di-GMP-specific phosphodiesterase class I)/CheY-like chemotaxis protein [Pelomonas saccharophila]|uniref:EAL domain-containing protein (Putative c-di-GMP-specific phosphodiesterase class I)/CheY-like chemotaxis protein n=1 Tax=Roseateles saccharophilus TaxID=304 RepID=A0ABU1YUF8_ROSSA|nr:EAL domain-containing response regulator [Roseateles saccharophilus]MDR7272482.1 EAL domain-containing protein (putative c-di-GMP-specific phosphodiesterase class I)/CheY-like chemotaxis protein [Roseateles saccharophilus]
MTDEALRQLVALVVEDSAVQRGHLVSLVQELKIGKVLQAGDGLEALRLLEQQPGQRIFLVITDIDMPGMDGIELIGRLAEGRQVENLIVTSARDPRLLETVESMGAGEDRLKLLGTLPKPVTAAALARLLEQAQPRKGGGGPRPQFEPDEAEICRALGAGEFIPHVQPKVGIATGLVKGVEALARWQHPDHGLLGPQTFIPRIEGTPLMARFTLSMVDQALRHLREWTRAMPALTLSLNLSADDLAEQAFIDRLTELVAQHGAAPASVIWEVTETMIMNSHSLANLARLGLKGFGLSMDDYGIGYSSMQTLSRSPFTELKIDRIFVNGASERSNRRAILNSSLDMGKRLGVCTVAEGVETVEDWKLLAELGCDVAQGYLIAKPMPANELIGWCRSQRGRLRALAAGKAV